MPITPRTLDEYRKYNKKLIKFLLALFILKLNLLNNMVSKILQRSTPLVKAWGMKRQCSG